ncbi:MAG: NUDIX domain-containing protein [Oscillospiraceae bacterium]|nr:NUDIX domain-containing protein [Oscillospiraceae bacterium]
MMEEQVFGIVSETLNVGINEITINSDIKNTLNWDSLNHVNLILRTCDSFNLNFKPELLTELTSTRKIIDYLKGRGGIMEEEGVKKFEIPIDELRVSSTSKVATITNANGIEMPVELSSMGIVIGEQQKLKKVLLLRDDEGSWVFPKGHVEEGETDRDAAIRELKEETGIELHPRQCLGKVHEFGFPFERKGVYKQINVFLFKTNAFGTINTEKDFMDGQWVDLPEAGNILQHEDAKNALNKAIDALNRENDREER